MSARILAPVRTNPPVVNPAHSHSLWSETWLDWLAFGAGLAMAWAFGWRTSDLVWSLWLASFVVGYAIVLWNIVGPFSMQMRALAGNDAPPGARTAMAVVHLAGAVFLLGFFTIHFGGFHFVHSIFLNGFFPALPGERGQLPSAEVYLTVVQRYWPFILAAFVAERAAFRPPCLMEREIPAGPSGQCEVSRELVGAVKPGGDMFAAYKNVVRLHLLIFFFAFISFLGLENFFVYAVVYAVYFFPWRAVRRRKAALA